MPGSDGTATHQRTTLIQLYLAACAGASMARFHILLLLGRSLRNLCPTPDPMTYYRTRSATGSLTIWIQSRHRLPSEYFYRIGWRGNLEGHTRGQAYRSQRPGILSLRGKGHGKQNVVLLSSLRSRKDIKSQRMEICAPSLCVFAASRESIYSDGHKPSRRNASLARILTSFGTDEAGLGGMLLRPLVHQARCEPEKLVGTRGFEPPTPTPPVDKCVIFTGTVWYDLGL